MCPSNAVTLGSGHLFCQHALCVHLVDELHGMHALLKNAFHAAQEFDREVLSSDAGLSVFVHHQVRDDHDEFRLRVEAQYFHPELHFRPTKLSPPKVSRRYNEGFSAHLWVEQGRPYWGMHKSLISGSEFCPSMPTHNALAAEVATRLNLAIQCRAMPKVGEVLAC